MAATKSLSRRDALMLGGVAAGAVAMGFVGGCASSAPADNQQATDGEGTAPEFVSLTEEERAAAVNNPIFMGAKRNKNGKEIVPVEMYNGGLAPEVCAEYDKQFDPQLIEVIPGKAYCSVGNTNANSVMVIGDTGIIIIDTAETVGTAQMDYDQFKTVEGVANRPVVACIATHDHYFGGTSAYVGEGNPNNIPIIAHERFMEAKTGTSAMNGPSMGMRATRQFGFTLPQEGPDALVGAGMGRFMSNPKDEEKKSGFEQPNTLIPESKEYTEQVIDGVRVQFWPLVSDSIGSMNIWFPDLKLAITNHVWNAFYNSYPLRGQIYRDPSDTIKAVDIALAWKPEYHCACHGLPLIGAEECEKEIGAYRDSLQFMYDQTLRGMNQGLTSDDVVRSITFPDEIIYAKNTKPLYGDTEYYIRAIYGGLVGWFGNDAIELHPVSKEFESKKFIEAMGGVSPALEECQRVLDDSQWAWAATLATHVLRVDPENADAKTIKAAAFRQMGYLSMDSSSRNWYLTEAINLENGEPLGWAGGPAALAGGLGSAEKNYIVRILGIYLNPEKAKGMDKTLTFNFVDTGDVETMRVVNCVARSVRGAIDSPDVELQMPFALLPAIVTGKATIKEKIDEGTIKLVGDASTLDSILGVFDMQL